MKLNSVSITISLLLLCGVCRAFAGGVPLADFSTPENTIRTYYNHYADRDVLSECFHPPGFSGSLDKFWSEYQIIERTNSTKTGESTNTGIVISEDAVELIVEVQVKDSENRDRQTKFWYLLQEIDGKWRIIDHSHIPDEVYPAYD